MSRMTYIFTFLSILITMSITNSPFSVSTEEKIQLLIGSKTAETQQRWSYKPVRKIAIELDKIAKKYDYDVDTLIALLDHESNFKYWIKSRKNRDGTRDVGLAQNNSRYVQYRCNLVLGRDCLNSELYEPLIAIKLAAIRLAHCDFRYSEERNKISCYNTIRFVQYRNYSYFNAILKRKKLHRQLLIDRLKKQS